MTTTPRPPFRDTRLGALLVRAHLREWNLNGSGAVVLEAARRGPWGGSEHGGDHRY
ncbi:MAG: hypothetical protein ACH36H_07650 [Candidatus Nanopelagicales bacterium]